MAGEGSLLLALPDPCLLRVLQCCAADDQRSVFTAARSHSRLHQAAVVALHSIAVQVSQQQQMDDVVGYMARHGQHVNSLELTGTTAYPKLACQLPQQLQPSSLQLADLSLQLQPGNGSQGVLGAAAPIAALKRLRLTHCMLLDGQAAAALAAALSQLPAGLESLSVRNLYLDSGDLVAFTASALQQLQHLTCLELGCVDILGADKASPALQALTWLVELQLDGWQGVVITSSMLSGMQYLTRLQLSGGFTGMKLAPGALASKTQLQHLCLHGCEVLGGAAGEAQLLSHLQPMQQLTHLDLFDSLDEVEESNPPASAYAALTASSKLQNLDISQCTLPAGVWQHVFPAGRQLPNLQSLILNGVIQPSGEYATAPEGSRLVSCCPGLQYLDMWSLRSPELAIVQGLSALTTLRCNLENATVQVVQAVCQLTRLRELDVQECEPIKEQGLLLQATQLNKLTRLLLWPSDRFEDEIDLSGGDEPVWQQLLWLHVDHPNPAVAQQAAAALVELE